MAKPLASEVQKEIVLESKKVRKLLFGAPLFSFMMLSTFFGSHGSALSLNRLGLLLLVMMSSFFWLMLLYRLLFKPTFLSIGVEGLIDNRLIGAVGFVPWSNVMKIGEGKFELQPFSPAAYIFVDLNDEKSFLAKLSLVSRFLVWGNKLGTRHSLLLPTWGLNLPSSEVLMECRRQMDRSSFVRTQ